MRKWKCLKLSQIFDNSGITAETRWTLHITQIRVQIESFRHEVYQGGHGGGWNDSKSIDKVSHYNIQEPIRSLNGFTVKQYWPIPAQIWYKLLKQQI